MGLKKFIKNTVKAVAKTATEIVKDPVKTVGNIANKAVGVASQYYTGGLLKIDKNGINAGISTDLLLKGVATVTGARAMEKRMNAETDQQRADQAKQNLISDALANAEAGSEVGQVNLRKRRTTNKISGAAGLGGVAQSDSTGVQS